MSRTWNTAPYRVRQRLGLTANRAWWASTRSKQLRWWSTYRNRQARRSVRRELDLGLEPEPYRTRNGATWDAH